MTAQINFSKGNDRHNLHSKSKKEHILTQSISNNIITVNQNNFPKMIAIAIFMMFRFLPCCS